jgi:hypothetical protein
MTKKIVRKLVGDHQSEVVIAPAPPKDAGAHHHSLPVGPGIHLTARKQFHGCGTATVGAEPHLAFAAGAGDSKYDLPLLHRLDQGLLGALEECAAGDRLRCSRAHSHGYSIYGQQAVVGG